MLTRPWVSPRCRPQDYGPTDYVDFKEGLCKFYFKGFTCEGKLRRWDFYSHLKDF